ncbi:MAG: hypothetical protein AAF411_28995 [Myxococcota bacterium]
MPDATADGSDVVTELIIDPTAARFAEQWVGYAREAQTFMVMNVGESVAPDLRAELTGEGAADYVIEANECRTLEPSASCALAVAFAPRAGGTRTATLEVRSGTGVARAELSGIGMDPNDYNRVFVSSESLSMLLGSPEAYDAECNRLATAAGINGPEQDAFIAWFSSRDSPVSERLGDARGFVRMDGRAFADDLLAGEVMRGVEFNEYGERLDPETIVVTGSQGDGSVSVNTCRNWDSTRFGAGAGRADAGPRLWTLGIGASCSIRWPIYCVETRKRRELIPPRHPGRAMYVTNAGFEEYESPEEACEASKPAGAGSVLPLVARTGTVAADIVNRSATYVRPDGIVVGTGVELVEGRWRTGVWQQGDGAYPSEGYAAWTGSPRIDAPGNETCSDWTSTDREIRGHSGVPAAPGGDTFWRRGDLGRRCSTSGLRFYCIETD